MSVKTKNGSVAAGALGIVSAVLLAAWVLFRSVQSGRAPGGGVIAALAVVGLSAAAVMLFGRSLSSCTVAVTFVSLMVTGAMTGWVLGVAEDALVRESMVSAAAFLVMFWFFDLLLKLLERRWFLIGTAVVSAAVYIVTLLAAKRTGGAALGISLFGGTVQLFELGKPLFIIVTASVMCIRRLLPSSKLLITLCFTIIHCTLLLMQSEMGTMLCIIAAYIGQLIVWLDEPAAALRAAFWDGKRKFILIPAVLAVVSAVAGILGMYPFIVDKIMQRLGGWLGGTYQVECGLDAMLNGGLTGAAGEKTVYIPYADSDMVFPSLIQHFGFAAGAALILVLVCFGTSVVTSARSSRSTIVCAAAVGGVIMLLMQSVIAICASTGLMPMTGITLPFISNGGVSLAVCGAVAGMIASAVRKTEVSGR